jgi:hypothetical protein
VRRRRRILIRSDSVFAGYYKEPEATASVLSEDGWLRTGRGEVDSNGFLQITDRKKDLIITAGGKNISPQNLAERPSRRRASSSQAIVVGDRRPYVTRWLTFDDARSREWARAAELAQQLVDGVNRDRTRVEQIKRFVVLPRDFSQEEGEVTPTLKLRRRVIHEHFATRSSVCTRASPSRSSRGSASRRRTRTRTSCRRGCRCARRRRCAGVDELPVADVDPDVAETREEDEVAGLELAPRDRDRPRVAPLSDGVVRQRDADLRVHVHHEAGTIEAARAGAAPHVRDAEILHRDPDDAAVVPDGRCRQSASPTPKLPVGADACALAASCARCAAASWLACCCAIICCSCDLTEP